MPTEEKLSLLRSVLQSPLFHQILALQKSVQHLRDQVNTGYALSSVAISQLQSSSHSPTGFSLRLYPVNGTQHAAGAVKSLQEIVCITCVLPSASTQSY